MYTIIGSDGKEYGPVSPEQIRTWLTQGRANLDNMAKSVGSGSWRKLRDLPEFADLATEPPVVEPPASTFREEVAPVKKKFGCGSCLLVCVGAFAVVMVVGLLTTLSSTKETLPTPSAPQPQPTSVPQIWRGKGQDLSISIKYAKTYDGRIVVSGTTNLPAKAALMISLTPKAPGQNPMQTQTVVRSDGTYVSEAFGPSSGVPEGRYIADVTLPIAHTQPESVRALIGDKGQNLKGPLVKDFSIWGNVASVEIEVVVGSPLAAPSTQWKLLDNDATRQLKADADQQAQQNSRPSSAPANGITRENTRSWL